MVLYVHAAVGPSAHNVLLGYPPLWGSSMVRSLCQGAGKPLQQRVSLAMLGHWEETLNLSVTLAVAAEKELGVFLLPWSSSSEILWFNLAS